MSSRRLCEETHVTVISTVSSCEVDVQQHSKGSTSTPPRVARLCQIRVTSLVALKKFKNSRMLTFVDRSNPPIHHIRIQRFQKSLVATVPLPSELVSLCSVPMPNVDLNLWNLSRPSAFVPMSLGFTSVVTYDIVRSFGNIKS